MINDLLLKTDEEAKTIIEGMTDAQRLEFIKEANALKEQKQAEKAKIEAELKLTNESLESELASMKSNFNIETVEALEEAVKTKGWAIQYITNPSEKLQLIAVGKDYDAIKYIKDPSEEVQIRAIDNYYAAIKYIENPTLNAKIEAVRQNGEAINYISNYDLDDVKMFISVNINVVKYVYESIDPDLVVEVLIDKFKDENIDDKYIRDFLELEVLEMNKIEFVREYGNKKTKKALVDYKLSM